MQLADMQRAIRDAMVGGDTAGVPPIFAGGLNPERRFAVHQRHYSASLTRALVERFPAMVWLTGSGFVTQAARSFIRQYPPTVPCLAEYGETFPDFIGRQPAAASLPYLTEFATLEWRLGRLALATDDSPNIECLHVHWSLDELIDLYLRDEAAERFELRAEDAWLELQGRRGELTIARITETEFRERTS